MSKKIKVYFLHLDFYDHSLNARRDKLLNNAIDFSIRTHSSRKYKPEYNGVYPYLHAYITDSNRNENLIKEVTSDINFIAKDQINLQDKVLYRTPKLDLPTMKVDIIKEKYNVSVKRDPAKADYIVTSHKFIESLFEGSWSNVIPSNDLERYFESHRSYFEKDAYDLLKDFFKEIEDDSYVKLTNKCSYMSNGAKLKGKLIPNHNHKLNDGRHYPHYVVDNTTLESLQDPAINYVLDSDIITFCNEDSVILKISEVKSIVSMLKSEDKTNHALALEMMANCNIEKSFDKIALLFSFYGNTLKYASNWNHVNVKSLKKIMKEVPEFENGRCSTWSFNGLVKLLHKKGKLTPFAVKAIQQKLLSSILNDVGLTHEKSVFELKPSDIKIKDDYTISDDLPF